MPLPRLRSHAPLALLGLALLAAPATAGDPLDLLRADPANRSGEREVSRAIVRMVGERSDSTAVRARASSDAPWGRLTVGPDEVLAEIGAVAALGETRALPSIVQPPAAPAPTPPAAASPSRPAPVAKPPAAPAQPAAAQAGTEEKPKRYFGIFVKPEPTERGGEGGGGGGGGGGGW